MRRLLAECAELRRRLDMIVKYDEEEMGIGGPPVEEAMRDLAREALARADAIRDGGN